MKKSVNIAIIAVFLGFIGLFFLLNIVLPDVEFSQQENTYLQMLPNFSLQELFSGRFTSDFEKYTTDQFPFRNKWIAVKARCELLTGKKENNGVYYCGDGVLINDYDDPGKDAIAEKVGYLNTLVDKLDIPVYFGLIPGAAEIESSLLPENAPVDSQQAVIDRAYGESRAVNIDISSALRSHADEYIYYRTDHHWTSLGAFYGYEALCQAMGLSSSPLSSYERETVSSSFYGTAWSTSGFTWVGPDEIETFVPDDGSVIVTNHDRGETVDGPLYDTSYLDVKDKYSMFLGGVSPLRCIHTGSDGPKILIVRDSYSDSLAPFLTADFSQIDLVDLRYYKDSLADCVRDSGYDMVLVLYSVSNFSTDQNLFLLSL